MLVSQGDRALAVAQTLRRTGWASLQRAAAGGPLPAEAAAVIVDPRSLERSVADACGEVQAAWPELPLIVVGDSDLALAIEALRAGAADYLSSSATPEDFGAALARVRVRKTVHEFHSLVESGCPTPLGDLWGESPVMVALRERIQQAAVSDATAVVLGETGTGKELVARLLHSESARRGGPFVVVSCSSVPPSLAESELFGHVKGAFSGASYAHRGLIPAAHGGTLFLDDVGALSLDMQAKLLRTLQEKSVRAVGANYEVPTDFRLFVSSSVPLDALVRERLFREDLYYRVAVLEIQVPPLRERGTDVLLLSHRFLQTSAARMGKRVVGLTPAAARVLVHHGWPGNVRELKNCIDYAVAVTAYDHIGQEDLPETVQPPRAKGPAVDDVEAEWSSAERRHIEAVLRSVSGNRSQAAILLGIDRKTLHRKLDRFQIDIPPRARSGTHTRPEPESGALAHPNRYRFNFR